MIHYSSFKCWSDICTALKFRNHFASRCQTVLEIVSDHQPRTNRKKKWCGMIIFPASVVYIFQWLGSQSISLGWKLFKSYFYYSDVIVCQITGIWIVCSTFCSGADKRKHQSSALLAFVRGITQTPVSGSCCLPLGALQSMWATWCKI